MNRRLQRTQLSLAVAAAFAAGWPLVPGLLVSVAHANPSAPIVSGGGATFQTQGRTLTVTNTPGAIINWLSFSIGAGETTRFQQQNATSTVLNRVRGQDPSQILGTLSSNGRVFLVNANGIVFGAGSRIDTQGMIASTLNISDDDFKKGYLRFARDGQAGAIQVNGYVDGGSGDVYIIAPQVGVGREGVIRSEGGNVVLAAGEKIEIASRNLNDMKFEVQSAANQATVLGKLAGGAVGVFAGTLRHSGDIRARTTENIGGRIVLAARSDVTLTQGSQTNAEGSSGGTVEITSATGQITVERGAVVSASAAPVPALPALPAMPTALTAPSTPPAIVLPQNPLAGVGGTVTVSAQQGNLTVEAGASLKDRKSTRLNSSHG